MGIAAAKMANKIIAPFEYDGTMSGVIFEQWLEKYLLPAIPEGTVIVMDNASFHRKNKLFEILNKHKNKYRLIFLPPYSPELNPIEKFWSLLKQKLRKILLKYDSFDDALFECFKVV